MIAVWAALLSGPGPWLAAVGVVGLGLAVWRARVWALRRQDQHQVEVRKVEVGDLEVAELEAWLALPDYQREEHPNA